MLSCPVLPDELLEEILTRVPVKDLMRFRCVSKWLRSLVFDPTFVKLHLQRSSKNTHTLLSFIEYVNHNNDDYVGGSVNFSTPCSINGLLENPLSTLDNCRHQHPLNLDVLGVCNGLVCLHDRFTRNVFNDYRFGFWNPASRIIMSGDSSRIRLRIRINDYGYPYFYRFGFGYDCWSDTYQVVVLDNKPQKMEVRVHCLGDTSWRRNTLTCPSLPILSIEGKYVTGTLNWLARSKVKSSCPWENVTINELVIFSYDLKNEIYSYLPMPDCLSEVPSYGPQLVVLNGCLCLSHLDHLDQRKCFVVWTMTEFGVENSWTQLLNISCEQLHVYDHVDDCLAILCMSENEDVVLLANYDSHEFILCNKRDNRIDRYDNFKEDLNYAHFASHDYVQSLVLPY